MARRHTSSRRGRRASEGVPWLALSAFVVVVGGVLGGLLWMYVQAQAQHQPLDADLCPVSTGPIEQTIVLVDATDVIAPITQTEIFKKVSDLANSIRKGGRFELRVLVPGADRTDTVFSKCNPGDGSDENEYTGNPALAQKKWVGLFQEPFQAAMQKSLGGGAAETSPIMGGIQQIAVDRLADQRSRSVPNRILIVSDMLENTKYFSIYQSGPDIDAYLRSPAQKQFNTDLAQAEVGIWLVERKTKVPTVALSEFWAEWVERNHGRLQKVTRLQGVE